jgi:adenylate kinase family enzyme
MSEWNYKTFEEKLGKKVNYGFILGKSLSGKTTVSKFMAEKLGYTFIDMKAIQTAKKEGEGEEGEAVEMSIEDLENEIMKIVNSASSKSKFVFDSYAHKSEE